MAFPAQINSAVLNGSNGFIINGIDPLDGSGRSVSSAGDLNGDGIDDVIVGAEEADPNGNSRAGESYVVFGRRDGFDRTLELSSLDGNNGFIINGTNESDLSGRSVSSAGDVNGDGISDVIVGAPGTRESYVVFGRSSGFDRTLELSSLDGSNGFIINGTNESDLSGQSVSSAGDVNGDGISDVIVGAPDIGESYVVFGRSSGFDRTLELSSLDGRNGFVINGTDEGDFAGQPVSGAGDVNADGIDDFIVSAPGVKESYVVFGRSDGFSSTLELSGLDGSNGFVVIGSTDDTGIRPVSSAGDMNGDGIDDFIVGASTAPARFGEGESYVVFGRSDGFSGTLDVSTLDGSDGFTLRGIDPLDRFGHSVSSAGDINGDGVSDIIVGAYDATPNSTGTGRAGQSYVVFGIDVSTASEVDPDAVDDVVVTDEDTILSGNVFADNGNGPDTDPEGDDFVVTEVEGRASSVGNNIRLDSGATLTLNADGSFDYDPNNQFEDLAVDETATDEFSYTINGGTGFGDTATVQITISGKEDLPAINLADLDGRNGFVINGIDAFDFSGRSISGAGDINGDGVDDVIIGADVASPNGKDKAGESYVVFGSSSEFGSTLELSNLDGSNGFVMNGVSADDRAGISVSSAGDINGDGIDDVIVGADRADPKGISSAGESYVVFGSSDGFGSTLELSSLDGSNGFVINGVDAFDLAGGAVSSAGDINGDGIDDVIVGAANSDPNGIGAAGESYVVFGSSDEFDGTLDLSSLDGNNGFTIQGINEVDRAGSAVSSAGDINGDGIDDVIVSATFADSNGIIASGASYVVFGNGDGFSSTLALSSLDGSNGFAIEGTNQFDTAGISVSSAGDFNGDGVDDVIVGADGAEESYVVFGSSDGFDSAIGLSNLDGSNGITIKGINGGDNTGRSVSSAGDFNGDGIDDVIVGADFAAPNGNGRAGESYVVFGRRGELDRTLDLSSFNDSDGFVINGIDADDSSGKSVSGAGDVNGDGFDDVIVSASNANPNGNSYAGESYVVFGRATGDENGGEKIIGTQGRDRLDGTAAADEIAGRGGDDQLFGKAGDDDIKGGAGNDTAVGGAGNDAIAGNSGNDVLFGDEGDDRVGGGFGDDQVMGGAGNDRLSGGDGNDNLMGEAGDDRLFGGNGDDALLGGGGKDTLSGGDGNDLLMGGQGNDRLIGGDGADVFLLGAGEGTDVITDFQVGIDSIRLAGGTSLSALKISQNQNSASLLLEGEVLARLASVTSLTTEDLQPA